MTPGHTDRRHPRSGLLLAAFVAAIAANLIHNRLGLDPAVGPAAVAVALYWWRPGQALLAVAAVLIGAPAILFFDWRALLDPGNIIYFLNHAALLAAGLLAALAVISSFVWSTRRAATPSKGI